VLLLENGAPTYRVEETLVTLARAFGLARIGIYATATGLIIGVEGRGTALTRVRRVELRGIDMNLLTEINLLSREAAGGALSPAQIAARIAAFEAGQTQYPAWLVVAGVALACGAFGLLIGAGGREFIATTLAAALTMILRRRLGSTRLIPLMVTVLAAFTATAASWLGCRALACTAPNLAPIGAVLQLVPGVPLVTAVIDLTTGDILSGVARGAYGVLIAFGIGLGMLLFLVWGL
jgi:uncharacterized membrane protein YjjP (DUF1212 family)